jgi:hypothetical protein
MSANWSRSLPATTAGPGEDHHTVVFRDREQAFEIEFAREEDMKFRSTARRNKLLGLWVAEKLGLSAADAADYARAVVLADLTEPGHGDVFSKVTTDLAARGVAVPDQEIRALMGSLMVVAEQQVRTDG